MFPAMHSLVGWTSEPVRLFYMWFSTRKCSVVLSEKQHGAVATLQRRTAPTKPTTVSTTLHNRIQGQVINVDPGCWGFVAVAPPEEAV